MLTSSQFKELFPNCKDPDGWVDAMNEVFPKYEIQYTRTYCIIHCSVWT